MDEKIIGLSRKMKDLVLNIIQPVDRRYMLECNVAFKDLPFRFSKNNVWFEIWTSWCIYNYKKDIASVEEIMTQNPWLNSNIRVVHIVMFNRDLDTNNINYLHHLC